MSDRSGDPDAAHLAALRARLYAPDSTAADRARYDEFLAHTLGAAATEAPDSDADHVADARAATSDTTPDAPAARRGRSSTAWLLIAVVLALAVGIATGAVVATRVAARAQARESEPTTSIPTPAVTAPFIPTPIAAEPLFGSVAEQNASAAALRTALAVKDSNARSLSLSTAGIDSGPHGDTAWSRAVGCSQHAGDGSVSNDGRPSGFSTAAGETGARPTGTRFRLKIHLTRAVDWSWVASGTKNGVDVGILAVGAGAAASGPAQYAQFTEGATTVVTAIRIVSTEKTPFLWQLQSCTPD